MMDADPIADWLVGTIERDIVESRAEAHYTIQTVLISGSVVRTGLYRSGWRSGREGEHSGRVVQGAPLRDNPMPVYPVYPVQHPSEARSIALTIPINVVSVVSNDVEYAQRVVHMPHQRHLIPDALAAVET